MELDVHAARLPDSKPSAKIRSDAIEVEVDVGVAVGVLVGVLVGVFVRVGVAVGVLVAVFVGVGVLVGVLVAPGVLAGVFVGATPEVVKLFVALVDVEFPSLATAYHSYCVPDVKPDQVTLAVEPEGTVVVPICVN